MSRTSGTEQRRRFTPDEKATILRRHLVDKVAALEARLARKDAIIADIAAEHLALNKKLGES